MKYIIIDNFNGIINILSQTEGEDDFIFDSAEEAQEYCNENAQDGQVVPLGVNLLQLMRDISGIIDHSLFELGEPENDEDTKFVQNVESQVNTIINGYYPKL